MNEIKKAALHTIDAHANTFTAISGAIWDEPELSLKEFKAAALYTDALEKLGFTVQKNLCGIETAFSGSYGSGHPVIGILGEYDALSGLSQQSGVAEAQSVTPGGNGHGCGHNLLGAASLSAAIAIKDQIAAGKLHGTVVFYGCPGEEGCAGKTFMARDGLFRDLDAAITWHPGYTNEVTTGSNAACLQMVYEFAGTAAHAAGNPWEGRSALDGAELMNIGVQFLREHMEPKSSIHYSIADAGGISPNVVQPTAKLIYMVRAETVRKAKALLARVNDIAKGAALMTGTTCERKFIDGVAETIPNHVLEALLYQNFAEVGVPQHTPEEMAFATELATTYDADRHIPGSGSENADYAARVKTLLPGTAMNDVLLPLFTGEAFCPGSTDVGDVSWQCPTAQLHVASWPNGCPGHSWQNVSCGKTSIGHKAAITAGKVLCAAAIDLLEQPELIAAAKTEFAGRTAESYTCPIPPEAVPTIPD